MRLLRGKLVEPGAACAEPTMRGSERRPRLLPGLSSFSAVEVPEFAER